MLAVGVSGGAGVSPEKHKTMAEIGTFFGGDNFFQVGFYLFWVCGIGKPETPCYPYAVGVGYNGGLSVNISHYEIGGLSPYSRKLCKLLYGLRYNAVKLVVKRVCHFCNASGFGFVKSAGTDNFRNFVRVCVGKAFQSGVLLKKLLCDDIHPCVCALG